MRSPKLRFIGGLACSLLVGAAAHAIPALQLGPGSGNWSYDNSTQTWLTTDNPLNLLATANATTGNGKYAWDKAGSGDQLAYLIVTATPKGTPGDAFDVTVTNDGGALSLYASGFGSPPENDPNSLAPHGVWASYYEVYEFDFDEALTKISDTQPGGTGMGEGYEEFLDIAINSLSADGLHFDLFTMTGDGMWDPFAPDDKWLVHSFAPWSHDAGTGIPEPSAALLFGLGTLVVGRHTRRR